MFKHSLFYFIFFVAVWNKNYSQELNARVVINSDVMPANIEKRIFIKLQNDIAVFLNNTKWTKDVFDYYEKIDCNFILNLEQIIDQNTFSASLVVQASRPVFNTTYFANLINITDREIVFYYIENQNIEFNENRIQANNPLIDNLSAIFAFYANMILGLDYNSFALKGGSPYFQKSLYISNIAPEHRYISGWNTYSSRRNRYWLADATTNLNTSSLHNVYYTYYREGLDKLIDNKKEAQLKILKSISQLSTIASENAQNLTITPLFMQGKIDELIRVFKDEDKETKKKFLEIIEKTDPNNYIRYQREIVF